MVHGFAVKFFMLILAVNPDGSPYAGSLHEMQVESYEECQRELPGHDQVLPDGRKIYFRCVVQSGA